MNDLPPSSQAARESQSVSGLVGKTIPHDSAVGHVTGSAAFIDDLPRRVDELYVGFAGSPVASGCIKSIDFSGAKNMPGVAGVYTHGDVGPHNIFGPLFRDEPFLADKDLLYVGQPVVLIAAETPEILLAAIAKVDIEYVETEPVFKIRDAVAGRHFIGPQRQIRRGDPQQAIDDASLKMSGEFEMGGQEQFYLESQSAVAYPGEQGQLVVHSSTQNTTEIQTMVAEVLGLSMHQVVCICKRMGGAFGGKETQAVIPALMVSLVAARTGRAARIVYDKDTDMRITGKRHPYLCRWKIGYESDGAIIGMICAFYSDGGAAADLSTSVMERTLLHAENAYYIPNLSLIHI